MFGWVSKPAARASVWNRVRSSGRERPVPSSLSRMVLTATVRPITGSTALYTTPMAPRPSSPTISYLPAFVTVGIVQSLCRPSKTALATQSPIERIGFRLWKAGNLTSPRTSIVHFLVLTSGMLRRRPGHLSCTVPTGFSFGQRYWGTSVSHSIRSERPPEWPFRWPLWQRLRLRAPTDELGVAHRFPGRHGAFRHRHIRFADRTIDFAGPCGCFESIGK